MGIPALVIGESAAGKSYGIKGLPKEGTVICEVEKPRLPFKNDFEVVKNAGYKEIGEIFKRTDVKRLVVDDSQYLLVNEFFDRATETGYQKFTDIALRFRNMIHYVIRKVPDDVVVYFLHHEETDANGKVRAKTIGKMLNEKLTVEGLFDIVLRAAMEGGEHYYYTAGGEYDTVKTPEGMFAEEKIPNDLGTVDAAIRDYYGMEA